MPLIKEPSRKESGIEPSATSLSSTTSAATVREMCAESARSSCVPLVREQIVDVRSTVLCDDLLARASNKHYSLQAFGQEVNIIHKECWR